MTEVLMPALSDSMEQGLVLQWLAQEGEQVKVGDELVEIETDKATMTYQAEVAGRLQIIAAAGATVIVGDVIAVVGEPNEAEQAGAERGEAVDRLLTEAAGEIAGSGSAPERHEPSPPRSGVVASNGNRRSTLATPVARRLASVHGIDLADLPGTGPRGRVTKADVLRATGCEPTRSTVSAAPPVAALPPMPGNRQSPDRTDRVELTRLQQLVARRMVEAKATIPHFQVQTEVVMDSALALREEFKRVSDRAPSVNDLIIKACALALRDHRQANGSYRDGRFELHQTINVGVAVAADGALVVPTVFDADTKSLGEIARETSRLAARVRSREVTAGELEGATFTVSNLGMYGMTAITPVINPPQAAILGIGALRETLARTGDEIVDRRLLTLTLSCDHRILYGADAARFLAAIRDILESPHLLCL